MVNMLYGLGQGYCGLTKEQYLEKEDKFKTIISEADTKDFTVTLTDGTTLALRLFVSDNDKVCFYAKGARSRGYQINLGKVERIEAKVKRERNKFQQFHKNADKAARLLQASGFWPDIRKRMEVQAAMTEEEYNGLTELYNEYWAIYDKKHLTYDEQEKLQAEVMAKFRAYYEQRGAESDFYHFQQLSETKQIISVPYSNGGYNKQRQVDAAKTLIQQVSDGEPDKHKSTYWYGSYDYSIEVRKNQDGTLCGWYSAEYKGTGNGHYYLLLDAEHAIYYEDD
jgi:hypothetical protein